MSNEQLQITAINNPVSGQPLLCKVKAGQTIDELFPDLSQQVEVLVNGEPLPEEEYDSYELGVLDTVEMKRYPAGSDNTAKNIGRTAMMLSVVALSAWAGPAGAGALGMTNAAGQLTTAGSIVSSAISAGVYMGGQWAVNRFVPPPSLNNNETDNAEEFNRMGALTGSRNQLAQYKVVPRVYGKHKLYPPMSAKPFTEVDANIQYQRLLFNLGPGPLQLSEPKIGETLIGSFDSDNNFTPNDNYENVEIDVAEQPDNYSRDIDQISPGNTLNSSGDDAVVTTVADTDEVSLELTFPSGLFRVTNNNHIASASVTYHLEYREVDTSEWNDVDLNQDHAVGDRTRGRSGSGQFGVKSGAKETYRAGVKFPLPEPGQYEIRITRNTVGSRVTIEADDPPTEREDGSELVHGDVWLETDENDEEHWWDNDQHDWTTDEITTDTFQTESTLTAFRSIKLEQPTDLPGTVQIGMRIKATDQLNGVLDEFSVVAESRLAMYGGSSWSEPTFDPNTGTGSGGALTSNPAWIFADILTGSANARAIGKDRLDADALKAWADWCDSEGFAYNSVIDSETTVMDMARSVASGGRASYGLQDGDHTVIRDLESQTPVQMFTPRNMKKGSFSSSKQFLDQPHALKVQFKNAESDWKTEEAIVYNDGYSEDGSGDTEQATRFETLQLDGITNWDQAWKMGRYRLAEAKLRPETYTLETDIEHLVAQRGDLVKVAHDVTLWGSRWGRIQSVTRNGSDEVIEIQTDEPAIMESGNDYQARVRTSENSFAVIDVDTEAGETRVLTVSSPADYDIAKGDLFAFGEQSLETVNLKIIGIEPQPDLSARLTLVDQAPDIHDADTGEIPDFDPQITGTEGIDDITPPTPSIDSIRSDDGSGYRDDDGSYRLNLLVSFSVAAGNPSLEVEGRYTRTDTDEGWNEYQKADANLGVLRLQNVERGKEYTIQIRSRYGENTSQWAGNINHVASGKQSNPSDVNGYSIGVDKTQVRHSWDEPVDTDIEKFEVRRSDANWGDRTTSDYVGRSKSDVLTSDIPGSGSFTYYIKAIDTHGNLSTNDASDTVNIDSKYTDDPTYPTDGDFMALDADNAILPDARVNLGLEIGTDVQAHDAQLDTLSEFSAMQISHLDAIDQDLGTTDSPVFEGQTLNGALNMAISSPIQDAGTNAIEFDGDGNVIFPGNATFAGGSTKVEPETIITSDPLLKFAEGNTTDALDIGFIGQRSSDNIGVIWDESADEIATIFTTDDGSTEGNVTIVDYADFHAGAGVFEDGLTAPALDITSGPVKTDHFVPGFTGTGWQGTYGGDWEMGNLSIRETLLVHELEVRKLRYSKGPHIFGPGGGKIEDVTDNGGDSYTLTFPEDPGITTDDSILVQEFNPDSTAVVRQARIEVTSVNGEELTGDLVGGDPPEVGDDIAVVASENTDRDSLIYNDPFGPNIDLLDGISNFTDWDDRSPQVRVGSLDGMPNRTGYGVSSERTYLTNYLLVGSLDKSDSYLEVDGTELNAVGLNLDVSSLPRVSDENLIALYRLDEGVRGESVGSVAVDSSARGNNGTHVNSPDSTEGVSVRGILYDSSQNQYTTTPNFVRQDETGNDYTVTAWFRADDLSDDRGVFGQDAGSFDFFARVRSNGDVSIGVGSGDAIIGNVSTGETHFLTIVLEGSDVKASLDGEDVEVIGDRNDYDSDYTQEFAIGEVDPQGNNQPFNGMIDEVRLYFGGLSRSEMKSLYTNPSGNSGGLISTDQLIANQGFFNEIFAQDVDLTGTLTIGTGGILEAESGAYSMDDDSFVIDVPNLLVDSTNEEIEVGSVFSADGANNTGALAGLDFDSGVLATGDGSLGSYTDGTVTGIQPRSSDDTRVFFTGADDKDGTNANMWIESRGRIGFMEDSAGINTLQWYKDDGSGGLEAISQIYSYETSAPRNRTVIRGQGGTLESEIYLTASFLEVHADANFNNTASFHQPTDFNDEINIKRKRTDYDLNNLLTAQIWSISNLTSSMCIIGDAVSGAEIERLEFDGDPIASGEELTVVNSELDVDIVLRTDTSNSNIAAGSHGNYTLYAGTHVRLVFHNNEWHVPTDDGQ